MRLVLILPLAALVACTPIPEDGSALTPQDSLPLLGGYRDPADPCQRVGENAVTNPFLDDSADLVACPAGMENIGVFVTETGAVQVADTGAHVLFSVPRG